MFNVVERLQKLKEKVLERLVDLFESFQLGILELIGLLFILLATGRLVMNVVLDRGTGIWMGHILPTMPFSLERGRFMMVSARYQVLT